MAAPTNLIPNLINDVVIEILSRLPIKSLLKFKCVSKSWFSLISSRQFTIAHFTISKRAPNYSYRRVMLNFAGILKHVSFDSLLRDPMIDAFDVDCVSQSVRFAGSCDGLICLCVGREYMVLWNPSTRKWKILPDFDLKTNFVVCAYGLGFDKTANDYKVVCFLSCHKNFFTVNVYSLKTNRWKKIKNYKGPRPSEDPATLSNGKLHWITNPGIARSGIVSLDLETEAYGTLHIPDYVKIGLWPHLVANEEGFYLFCSHQTHEDVWIIEGYGVREITWTKVVSIPCIDDLMQTAYRKPLYVLKNDEVLLLCRSRFVIYSTKNGFFRYPEVKNPTNTGNSDYLLEASIYVESLVSL